MSEEVMEVSVEVKTEKTYDELVAIDIQDSYNYVTKYDSGVDFDAFKTIYEEMRENKSKIDELLELNLENKYRKVLNVKYEEHEYREMFSLTAKLIQKLTDGLDFSITENKIEIEPKKFQKLSRFLSPKFVQLEEVMTVYHNNLYNSSNGAEYKKLLYGYSLSDEIFSNYADCRAEMDNPKDLLSNIIERAKGNNICISTNICDFFTSSTNSAYSSCFHVNGCYFSGNMSYMRDNFTVISFTYVNDIRYKIGRNRFYLLLDKGKIMHPSRTYGTMFKREQRIVRTYIEDVFSNKFEITNKWGIRYRDLDLGTSFLYFDGGNVVLAYNKEFITKNNLDNKHVNLDFELPRCLSCGTDYEGESKGYCCSCGGDYCCEDCGCGIHEDDVYWYGDSPYCRDCFNDSYGYCNECDEAFHNDDITYVEDTDQYVCSNCLDRYYSRCEHCDEYVSNDNIVEVDDGNTLYCTDCIDRGKVEIYECTDCGDVFTSGMKETHDGKMICSDCFDNDYGSCESCEKIFHIDDLEDGKCPDCEDSDEEDDDEETEVKKEDTPVVKKDCNKEFISVDIETSSIIPSSSAKIWATVPSWTVTTTTYNLPDNDRPF